MEADNSQVTTVFTIQPSSHHRQSTNRVSQALPSYANDKVRCGIARRAESTGVYTRDRYHGGRRPSSDDSFHSPTVILPLAFDKPSIMKRYHRRRTCSHTSPRRSPSMVTLHDTRFVNCRCWSDCWTVKTVVT